MQNCLHICNYLYLCQVLTLKNLVMIEQIKAYEQELKFQYEELMDAFGPLDSATQRAFLEWNVMDELLTRLNLQDEK